MFTNRTDAAIQLADKLKAYKGTAGLVFHGAGCLLER
jgi:predicted phosphoribosyltransferase